MTNIRITKEFTFDMAHALLNYDGLCRNIHGHTYKLAVTLLGSPIETENSPKLGMVLDFGDLKTIVKHPIVDRFDHALVLHEDYPLTPGLTHVQDKDKLIRLPFQPTCENILIYFVEQIKERLPEGITLCSVKLHETPTSYAEWLDQDN